MTNQAGPIFTAAEIGAAIGRSRFAVARLLQSVPPSGLRPDRQNASAWAIGALPGVIVSAARGVFDRVSWQAEYETLADVFRLPPDRWKPAAPLAEIHADEIKAAEALQSALRRGLALPADATDAERARVAAPDYAATFGREVSERHLRKLIRRTLDRDRGEEAFERLELYLPEKPRLRAAKAAPNTAGRFLFTELEDAFALCSNRHEPTAADKFHCWGAVCEFWLKHTGEGEPPAGFRPALLAFLDATLPRLGKTRAALERALDRQLARFKAEGRAGLIDGREANGGRHRTPSDYAENIGRLKTEVFALHGDISQAWRNLQRGTARSGARFSDEFCRCYPYDVRKAKSQVPNSIRREMRCLYNAAEPFLRGPKAVRLAMPPIQRDWSKVAAGDLFSGDDFTLNHYFY